MRKNEIVVDSRFFVPSNIVDLRYRQDYDISDSFGWLNDDQTDIQYIQPADPGQTVSLPTPNITFDIISQTIKTAPDGTQTVDVVIELPDVTGAEYNVEITRIV